MSWSPEDVAGMTLALALAEEAARADEVPIGAVVVRDGALLGAARNACRGRTSAVAHAEMLALDEAFRRTGDMRLPGAVVYTTVEPCFMCAGALSHARVNRVVWAARDPKFGGAASLGTVLTDTRLNHVAEVREGLFEEEAAALLRDFFRAKRKGKRRSDQGRANERRVDKTPTSSQPSDSAPCCGSDGGCGSDRDGAQERDSREPDTREPDTREPDTREPGTRERGSRE